MFGRLLIRFLIFGLAALIIGRALRNFFAGIRTGFSQPGAQPKPGGKRPAPPEKAQAMARDPVCGTFVVPARALTLKGQSGLVYFCSDKCRQAYQARP